MINKIVSGGQTGADMGGLLAAELIGIPRGGYCPNNFSDENGFNDEFVPRFGLTPKGSLKERTVYNVAESDGTVIFSKNLESTGTKTTIGICEKLKRPYYIVKSLRGLRCFLSGFHGVLNVAGMEPNGQCSTRAAGIISGSLLLPLRFTFLPSPSTFWPILYLI